MTTNKFVLEWKDRRLSRPTLDGIVGAALRTNPDTTEVIVRCRTAASTVYKALEEGYPVTVTIVTDEGHASS